MNNEPKNDSEAQVAPATEKPEKPSPNPNRKYFKEFTPSEKQIALAKSIVDIRDTRTPSEKAVALGIDPRASRDWLNQSTYVEFINSLLPVVTDSEIATAWSNVISGMQDLKGSERYKWTKLFLELKNIGAKGPSTQVNAQFNILGDGDLLEQCKSLGITLPENITKALNKNSNSQMVEAEIVTNTKQGDKK